MLPSTCALGNRILPMLAKCNIKNYYILPPLLVYGIQTVLDAKVRCFKVGPISFQSIFGAMGVPTMIVSDSDTCSSLSDGLTIKLLLQKQNCCI